MRALARLVVLPGLATLAFLPGPAAGTVDGLVRVEAVTVSYREPGEWTRGRAVVDGPLTQVAAADAIVIMATQVTAGAYGRCVTAGACAATAVAGDPALPVVGVSFTDAEAYATWLSAATGRRWRLPTDREWALAAGSRYRDDAVATAADPANPARRWLRTYEAESARAEAAIDPAPQPAGHYGVNEYGLADLAGNVWEWTSTCYARHATDPSTGRTRTHESCGTRIAEGRHRAYVAAFLRDPKAGACSVGLPPANLGFRLVREEPGPIGRMLDWIGW